MAPSNVEGNSSISWNFSSELSQSLSVYAQIKIFFLFEAYLIIVSFFFGLNYQNSGRETFDLCDIYILSWNYAVMLYKKQMNCWLVLWNQYEMKQRKYTQGSALLLKITCQKN